LITTNVVDKSELSIIKEKLGSMAEIETLNDVHVAMVINEQAAGFCLPDLSGKVDFRTGFAGTDVNSYSGVQSYTSITGRGAER